MVYLITPLNTELNPICHLLALIGAHRIPHVSRMRVKAIVRCLRYVWVIHCVRTAVQSHLHKTFIYNIKFNYGETTYCILLNLWKRTFSYPCLSLKKICPASFRETCQWLKFPLNGIRAHSRIGPVIGLLPLTSGPACLGMAFPPFLVKQLYRCDSVVISSFARTGYITRRWGWLLGRIGYSITHRYPLYLMYYIILHNFALM